MRLAVGDGIVGPHWAQIHIQSFPAIDGHAAHVSLYVPASVHSERQADSVRLCVGRGDNQVDITKKSILQTAQIQG